MQLNDDRRKELQLRGVRSLGAERYVAFDEDGELTLTVFGAAVRGFLNAIHESDVRAEAEVT